MKKKFNNNDDYFSWYNKNSNRIKLLKITVKDNIVAIYEKKLTTR